MILETITIVFIALSLDFVFGDPKNDIILLLGLALNCISCSFAKNSNVYVKKLVESL